MKRKLTPKQRRFRTVEKLPGGMKVVACRKTGEKFTAMPDRSLQKIDD